KGNVIINNGGLATSNVTTISGGDFGQVTVAGGATVSVANDMNIDTDGTFTGSNVTVNGGITSFSNLTLDGSTLTISGRVNVAKAITLKNGSILTHSRATATAGYKLDVTAGTVNIND